MTVVGRSASLRDPAGRLFERDGRLYREVTVEAEADTEAFLESRVAQQWVEQGRFVATRRAQARLYEHDVVQFVSYPYEWSDAMLFAAGTLTLDLADDLLDAGFGLKDATPYNVLFRGVQPVFVDLLSIERRDPGDAIWLPYAQFVRTFILPLLVARDSGLSAATLLATNRDGVTPEAAAGLLKARTRYLGAGLPLVTIPRMLQGGREVAAARRTVDPEQARFVLRGMFRHLRRSLKRAYGDRRRVSVWVDYATCDVHTRAYHDAKQQLVADIVRRYRAREVLALGCNTGANAIAAALAGASVVAVDSDAPSIDVAFVNAAACSADVLPLVVDLSDPTSARGWMHEERLSFLARATGRFDVVLALALIHHLMVSAGIPLGEIFRFIAAMTRDVAVVEFIPFADPQFQRLLRGRADLYRHYDESAFRAAAAPYFELLDSHPLPGAERVVHVFRKRASATA